VILLPGQPSTFSKAKRYAVYAKFMPYLALHDHFICEALTKSTSAIRIVADAVFVHPGTLQRGVHCQVTSCSHRERPNKAKSAAALQPQCQDGFISSFKTDSYPCL
jgi:hypothetical protein